MVKRSRHRPFTAVTRVRFPMESPNRLSKESESSWFLFYNIWMLAAFSAGRSYARLAELADALDLGSSGRPWGFKSLIAHQTETPIKKMGVFVWSHMMEGTWTREGVTGSENVLWTFEPVTVWRRPQREPKKKPANEVQQAVSPSSRTIKNETGF